MLRLGKLKARYPSLLGYKYSKRRGCSWISKCLRSSSSTPPPSRQSLHDSHSEHSRPSHSHLLHNTMSHLQHKGSLRPYYSRFHRSHQDPRTRSSNKTDCSTWGPYTTRAKIVHQSSHRRIRTSRMDCGRGRLGDIGLGIGCGWSHSTWRRRLLLRRMAENQCWARCCRLGSSMLLQREGGIVMLNGGGGGKPFRGKANRNMKREEEKTS